MNHISEFRNPVLPKPRVIPTFAGGKFVMQRNYRAHKTNSCLFIIPPFYRLVGSHNNRLNVGISSLAALCNREGIETQVFHADSDAGETYPTRYQLLLNSPSFYGQLHTHPIFEEVREYVCQRKPEVVIVAAGDMINSFTDTGSWPCSLRIAAEVRRASVNAYILGYGPEIPESGAALGDFDAVVTSDAEAEFFDILRHRPRGRRTPAPVTEDILAQIPIFTKELLAQEDLSPQGFDLVHFRRGCIGRCQFCRVANRSGGAERFRPVEQVIAEIQYRYQMLGVRNFYFCDPNFTSYPSKVIPFATALHEHFPDITWRAESRFDTVTPAMATALKAAGCTFLKLGLENALGEDHQTPSKRISLKMAREKIAMLHDVGLRCVVYLLLGGAWYTEGDYDRMYENAAALNADGYTVSLMAPYVGTGTGIPQNEWDRCGFTGSHLDLRLADYWQIPRRVLDRFFALELSKGREDRSIRNFH